jgi:uncharacterized protein (AIM24 family)
MEGAPRDPTAREREPRLETPRLTPTIGVDAERPDVPSEASNDDFLVHLHRGRELLLEDRVHEAKVELERALVMRPSDAKGQDLLAIVYFRLGLYPRAIAIYEQLRREGAQDSALILNLALCYLKTGQPSLAHEELAELVKMQPGHTRAWGYLGLASERLGDLQAAREAFERGGHAQLVRRVESRIAGDTDESSHERDGATGARAAAAAALDELDTGDLSFVLAAPASASPAAPESGMNVERGGAANGSAAQPPASVLPNDVAAIVEPEAAVSSRQAGARRLPSRRPTLIAPAAPAPETALLESALESYPSPGPPRALRSDEEVPPSVPLSSVVAPPPATAHLMPEVLGGPGGPRQTLPPMLHRQTAPLPEVAPRVRDSLVVFPPPGEVVVHATGVALVQNGAGGFHARPEALWAAASKMTSEVVLRHVQGRATSEPLGGLASPLALFQGTGQLVVGARPGRKLSSFLLAAEVAFVREEVLLGFDGNLAHQSGRVSDANGDTLEIVQLEGSGAVVLEVFGDVLGLDVTADSGLLVRRDAVVAWFGRLVARAVPPAEAPGAQRGLLSFGGEGSVLFATA